MQRKRTFPGNRYSVDINRLGLLMYEPGPDPSVDVLTHLARAYAAVQHIIDSGADTSLSGNQLVIPAIERAYREALYLRTRLPKDGLDETLITRFGRLVDGRSRV
jgi:hypothetical protein